MSSYEEMRAKLIKQTRREILRILAIEFAGQNMGFPMICTSLTHLELPSEQVVMSDLAYLCEKGYVRWTNTRLLMPWKERMYHLTATGNDIVNRIAIDPTLEP